MNLSRRAFVRLAAGTAAAPGLAVRAAAQAESYPSRAVRIVVGFAPGGSTDLGGRVIAQWLTEKLGKQFIVDNRPGTVSNIAAESVVHAAPDGHTLLLVSSADTINASLHPRTDFNFLRDIAPVASLTQQPQVLLANPAVPVKTFAELVVAAKAKPGAFSIASAGNGSISHLSGEMLKMMAGVDLLHIPYRGSGPALIDLLAGNVQLSFSGMAGAIHYLKSGRLRALAVTTAKRSDVIPDVPAIAEHISAYEAVSLFGIGAPKDTPPEIIGRLNAAINAGLADPKVDARYGDLGGTVLAGTPASFGNLLADETSKWEKVIKNAGIKTE